MASATNTYKYIAIATVALPVTVRIIQILANALTKAMPVPKTGLKSDTFCLQILCLPESRNCKYTKIKKLVFAERRSTAPKRPNGFSVFYL